MKKKLRTVVLYNRGHLGSIIVLNKLMKMKCYNVVGVVKANNVSFTRKGMIKMTKQISRSGILFMTMLVIQQLVQEVFFLLPFSTRKTKTSNELEEKYNFSSLDCETINNKESRKFLKKHKPDIIISAYFPQILKPSVLDIPRLGVLNIHPGLIPEYKGVMAYFRALKNNSSKAGVSIHRMDKGIDTGPIIAKRSFRVSRDMSQDKVLIKTATIGSSLLKRIGMRLRSGKEVKVLNPAKETAVYYSLPRHKDFISYRNHRSFFSFRAILKSILGKHSV